MTKLPAHLAEETLDLACQIQAIPAPTFNEAQRAAFFLKQFRALGLKDVQMDATGNVLARYPGRSGQRPLVVSAHMDTVHPVGTPLFVQKLEDRLVGPGIGDNALGLAALIALARVLKLEHERLPGDVWLAANVGEEGLGDLRGMQGIVDQFGSSPLAYLVIEGMGLGTVLHRGLGVERYKITVQTPGGHSWVDYGQPSAIHEISAMVSRLASIPLPRTPCTTLNVGVIQGGTSINTIAANAWIELDLRSEDSAALARLVREVHAIAYSYRRKAVQVSVERIGKRASGHIPTNHPLVELAREVLSELNLEARLDIASTDANLPLSRGYPAICIGVTNGNNAHTRDEFILTGPVSQGLLQLSRLVSRAWERLA